MDVLVKQHRPSKGLPTWPAPPPGPQPPNTPSVRVKESALTHEPECVERDSPSTTLTPSVETIAPPTGARQALAETDDWSSVAARL